MRNTKIAFAILFILSIVATAAAQSGPVSLKPVLKPGQENRYIVTAAVDMRVSPTGSNGISTNVHREITATVLFRATGDGANEAIIEAIATRTTVDGVEKPTSGSSLVGQKIAYKLDSVGRPEKINMPQAAAEAGLAEIALSLTTWSPATEVLVGQTWGQRGENLLGDFGLISAPSFSEILKGTSISYKLSAVEDNKAIIDGTLSLTPSGTSLLTTKEGRINVGVVATANGSSRIEYDVNAGRIIAATTESSLEGRLASTPPKPAGEKLQPREGSVVETTRYSVKLVP